MWLQLSSPGQNAETIARGIDAARQISQARVVLRLLAQMCMNRRHDRLGGLLVVSCCYLTLVCIGLLGIPYTGSPAKKGQRDAISTECVT